MSSKLKILLCLLLLVPAQAEVVAGQELERPLRVFLDCSDFGCDHDYVTQQIDWVAFVRDRTLADIHLFITHQRTGVGGGEYTLRFIGRAAFAGDTTTLRYISPADATDDDVRQGLVRVARLGLAPHAAATPQGARLRVEADSAQALDAAGPGDDDPWNQWTFEVGADAHVDGETRQQSADASTWFGANRTTNAWKNSVWMSASLSRDEFELEDSTTFVSSRESFSVDALSVKAISQRWSVGAVTGWSRSTFSNYDSSVRLSPAIEYDLFPYGESTRRLLTVLYAIGPRYFDYAEPTIFGEHSESVLEQLLVVSYDVNQPWGTVDVAMEASHLIARIGSGADWPEAQYSLEAWGGLEVRLLRGLSLELDGNVELVRDQIHLAAGDLSDEEILTQQRELATDYRYWTSVGLSYRFGSIYSAVVNPRFDYFD